MKNYTIVKGYTTYNNDFCLDPNFLNRLWQGKAQAEPCVAVLDDYDFLWMHLYNARSFDFDHYEHLQADCLTDQVHDYFYNHHRDITDVDIFPTRHQALEYLSE